MHGVHCHIHMSQLWHDRWVWAGKYCIGLWQSFHIIALSLNSIDNNITSVYQTVRIFWRGWKYTIYVLYRHCIYHYVCARDRSLLFKMGLVEKCLEIGPCIEFDGLLSALSIKVAVCAKRSTLSNAIIKSTIDWPPASDHSLLLYNWPIRQDKGSVGS